MSPPTPHYLLQESSQCVEGCVAKKCPPGFIRDKEGKCIPEADCDGCGFKDGKWINEGDVFKDPCW